MTLEQFIAECEHVEREAFIPEWKTRKLLAIIRVQAEALEKIASFAYGDPVDKTFDAREAQKSVEELINGK